MPRQIRTCFRPRLHDCVSFDVIHIWKYPFLKTFQIWKYISNKHIFSFVTEKRLFVMRREKKTINNMMILDIWNSYIALRWRDEIKRSSQLRTPLKRVVKYESNSWLVSSVGRALHRCRRGHRFKSCTGLKVFSRSYFQLLVSVVFLSARISLFHI